MEEEDHAMQSEEDDMPSLYHLEEDEEEEAEDEDNEDGIDDEEEEEDVDDEDDGKTVDNETAAVDEDEDDEDDEEEEEEEEEDYDDDAGGSEGEDVGQEEEEGVEDEEDDGQEEEEGVEEEEDDGQEEEEEFNDEGEMMEEGRGGDASEGRDDMMLEDLLETMLDERDPSDVPKSTHPPKDEVLEEGEGHQGRPKKGQDAGTIHDADGGKEAHDGEDDVGDDHGHDGMVINYIEQFDEMYKSFPRNPVDGTINVDELSIEQRKVYNAKVMSLLTENQMDRYECFRRSSLKEPMRRLVQLVVGGGQPKNTDKIVIAMSGVAKVFVGELIEEARRIANVRGNHGPLSKEDVCEAYFRVSSSSKELQHSCGKRMRL